MKDKGYVVRFVMQTQLSAISLVTYESSLFPGMGEGRDRHKEKFMLGFSGRKREGREFLFCLLFLNCLQLK